MKSNAKKYFKFLEHAINGLDALDRPKQASNKLNGKDLKSPAGYERERVASSDLDKNYEWDILIPSSSHKK